MDRKGTAIITACVLFIIIWQFYVAPKYFPVRQPAETPPAREPAETEGPGEPTPAPQEPTTPPAEPQAAPTIQPVEAMAPGAPAEQIVLRNSVCEFTFTSAGAALKKVRLKDFVDDRKKELTLVEPFDEETPPLGLEILRPQIDLRTCNYSVASKNEDDAVQFDLTLSNGLRVEKEMRITPHRHDFTLMIRFSNTSNEPLNFTVKLHGPGSMVREDDIQNYLTGALHYIRNRKTETKSTRFNKVWQIPKEIPVGEESASTSDIYVIYIGACNRFFGSALLAKEPLLVRGLGTRPVKGKKMLEKIAAHPANPTDKEKRLAANISSYVVMAPIGLDPGESEEFTFTFYAGPKQAEELAKYGPLSRLLDYGIFGSISKILLAVLRFLYSVTGNYGVAIILMTILVKMVLFPLSRKGTLSQAKQQKLAPQIKELQAKYKNNKQKVHQEMMKLYRQEGVHPLGGCLPMLLQLPVFIGLLRLLQYSIEIRQASFIPGWIDDLSKPDTIAALPEWIPLLGGRLNLLPFIMGAVSILQQKMMPKPADPQAQQQMMMFKFMPIIFVFILYNWPAGLLLYWTVSSGLSVVEQYFLRKSLGKT